MAEVVLESLTKKFGEVTAVKEVDLTIHDREFTVLLGPSGCGKTTTLRCIAGLEDVTGGNIYMDGRRLNDVLPRDRDIAMVFQNYALYPHMTVYKNMAFGLKLRRLAKEKIDERVNRTAGILGIEDLLHRRPRELSGGQRQRVAVGRAIVRNPRVFLFDEPLSNLDAKLRVQTRVELLKLHQQLNATSIYVTHDQVEAMTMGDRIVIMLEATIQQVGSPMEVYQKPVNQFVAGFIGSPAMNFTTARVTADDGRLFIEGKGFKFGVSQENGRGLESYRDQEVTFGIRPEDLRMDPNGGGGDSFEAVVDIVQPVGSDIFLELNVSGDSITARVEANAKVNEGDRLRFYPVPGCVHAFDTATGTTIL
ncbi:MAG: sn-glycerol-3-phosphate ABC transporter ATP-binding protein UgpC [bacterium]